MPNYMLQFVNNVWPVLLALTVSLGIITLMHIKLFKHKLTNKAVVMLALNFCIIFLSLLLILKFLVPTKPYYTSKPTLVLAIDNSKSLQINNTHLLVKQKIKQLTNALQGKYKVISVLFGNEARLCMSDTLINFKDTQSNYQNVLEYLSSDIFRQPPASIILLGDGIYNSGYQPTTSIKPNGIKVYTIGFGDTIQQNSASISEVHFNNIAYVNDSVVITASIYSNFKVATKLDLKLLNANRKLQATTSILTAQGPNYKVIELMAPITATGLNKFDLQLVSSSPTPRLYNTSKNIIIEGVKPNQKVALLNWAPDPNSGVFKDILQTKLSCDVDVYSNTDPIRSSDYNLYIINQWHNSLDNNAFFKRLQQGKASLLFIITPNTPLSKFNKLNLGLKLSPINNKEMLSKVQVCSNFGLFALNDSIKKFCSNAPPLNTGNYEIESTNGYYPVLETSKTQKPVLLCGYYEERTMGFLLANNWWQWRLHNAAIDSNTNTFSRLTSSLLSYLLANKVSRLLVNGPKLYNASNNVTLQATFLNDLAEPNNSAPLDIKLYNMQRKLITIDTFLAVDNNYFINFGRLPEGSYSYKASLNFNGLPYVCTGAFFVAADESESLFTQANFDVLKLISSQTSAQFYTSNQLDELIRVIKHTNLTTKTVGNYNKPDYLIRYKPLLFLLIGLLFSKWLLEKVW